ncbi:sensor histidine kinase [Paraburkholderia nodosa]|uniref:sensor histidine kinase n=1 Tax=Paraburkholderia nodosa TaxID=392320 RepID=UPI001376A65F|nr:ATP-binding protein [Paraburkholderia nodosa]
MADHNDPGAVNTILPVIDMSDPAIAGRCAVIVGLLRMRNYVQLDVLDNGIGVAPEHREAIFSAVRAARKPGAGPQERAWTRVVLGLSIVNAVMSLLEGHHLELKSIEGRASRFSVCMPLADPLSLQNAAISPCAAATLPSPSSLRGLYVLLVEDDSLVRASMEVLFGRWGAIRYVPRRRCRPHATSSV